MSWETSFVAMSVALGVDVAQAAASILSARDPETRRLVALLGAKSKAQRAQALAAALGPVAKEIAAADLGAGA